MALLIPGCGKNKCMAVDKSRIFSICNEAITNRYPDIRIDSLKLKGISYDTINSGRSLVVKFWVINGSYKTPENDERNYEIWISMNEDGSEAIALSMKRQFRVDLSSE